MKKKTKVLITMKMLDTLNNSKKLSFQREKFQLAEYILIFLMLFVSIFIDFIDNIITTILLIKNNIIIKKN